MKKEFTPEYLLSLTGRVPLIERLNRKVIINERGCHEYSSNLDRCGYGRFKVGKHQLGAHKVMYLLTVGNYDQINKELMHICDNPACINPEHLKPGTHKENIQDCIMKGRHTSQRYPSHIRVRPPTRKAKPRKTIKSSTAVISFFSSRKLAISNGDKTYIGSNCSKHHLGIRKTNNGACIYCMDEYRLSKKKSRGNKSR